MVHMHEKCAMPQERVAHGMARGQGMLTKSQAMSQQQLEMHQHHSEALCAEALEIAGPHSEIEKPIENA